MNSRKLQKLGMPPGAVPVAQKLVAESARAAGLDRKSLKSRLAEVIAAPEASADDPVFGELARAIIQQRQKRRFIERDAPAPVRIWGRDLEAQAVQQMHNAARLPVAVAGALMPDAHLGYGLPIGGVLATDNAVIPYAVGVDIACRMRLSIFDVPADQLERLRETLKLALERETRFGIGAQHKRPLQHDVLDDDWSVSPIAQRAFEKARQQLGTSGSGNHFVEWGTLEIQSEISNHESETSALGLPPGKYLALLSHSGSRGTGAQIADYYSRLAMAQHPDLPPQLKHLAWLDLDGEAGQEYWAAMQLMGKYAAANHELIHKQVSKAAGLHPAASVENHHNFAWIEEHFGRRLVVHRKGATPAGEGVLGVIPGSMATPGYVVRGRGVPESLMSASHGAGRAMSRTAARNTFRWHHVQPLLEQAGVELLSAGIDEAPMAYKNINEVMAAQSDLVEIIARFSPRIVKMAPAGERPED